MNIVKEILGDTIKNRYVSVFSIIKFICKTRRPLLIWDDVLEEYGEDAISLVTYHIYDKERLSSMGFMGCHIPYIDVKDIVKLLLILPGKTADKLRLYKIHDDDFTEDEIISSIICKQDEHFIVNSFAPPIGGKPQEQSSSTDVGVVPFTFEGIFRGREKEIRITPDKQISVFDFIRVVGNQKNYKDAWKRILENHENEIVAFCDYSQFGKTKKTPVISVQGMVKLLFWIPGETAKQFRSKSAEVMIRYLGGDLTLIDEIRSIDQHHRENPDNVARVFREEVVLFNQDQINISNRLINHFGNKTDIFYLFSFKHSSEWYAKFGIVGEVREFHKRITEHKTEFENICFHHVIQCSNVYKIESEFKESALYSINKAKIPKKNGGFHVEILKLSESVTSDVIASEITKIAGDRILDPPPEYPSQTNVSLEVEKEKTKQLEIQSKSQIRLAELSNQLELEKLRISLEIEKLKYAKLT